ncbi:hypothetical protein G7046_g2849 [Stylonectria norvegica]|nr:hypothetical protein G7046_g2849 [Stylonectria norvegica]
MANDHTFAVYPSLEKRVVVISGGATGIGASMVEAFAFQGSRVIILDILQDAASILIKRLFRDGVAHSPIFYNCDVTEIDGCVKPVAKKILADFPKIDAIINNAAADTRLPTLEITTEDWDRGLSVNLRHQFFLTQALMPGLIAAGSSSVINMGSITWAIPGTDLAPYIASKSAVVGLTKTLAHEFGPMGVRVNSIMPGAIATERQKREIITPEYEATVLERQALKKILQPVEVARVTAELASSNESFIFGEKYGVGIGTKASAETRLVQHFWSEEERRAGKDDRMRANDGAVDSKGRFWVNFLCDPEVTSSAPEGVLFRLDTDDTFHRIVTGVTIPNGMTSETASIVNKQVSFHVEDKDTGPDGPTQDEEGNLWVAVSGTWKVAVVASLIAMSFLNSLVMCLEAAVIREQINGESSGVSSRQQHPSDIRDATAYTADTEAAECWWLWRVRRCILSDDALHFARTIHAARRRRLPGLSFGGALPAGAEVVNIADREGGAPPVGGPEVIGPRPRCGSFLHGDLMEIIGAVMSHLIRVLRPFWLTWTTHEHLCWCWVFGVGCLVDAVSDFSPTTRTTYRLHGINDINAGEMRRWSRNSEVETCSPGTAKELN